MKDEYEIGLTQESYDCKKLILIPGMLKMPMEAECVGCLERLEETRRPRSKNLQQAIGRALAILSHPYSQKSMEGDERRGQYLGCM